MFQEGWYRFEGDAGAQMADNKEPPAWEDCGTSRVVWLQGDHPGMGDGTVDRAFCVTGLEENCETTITGRVRTCSDKVFLQFVYGVVPISITIPAH